MAKDRKKERLNYLIVVVVIATMIGVFWFLSTHKKLSGVTLSPDVDEATPANPSTQPNVPEEQAANVDQTTSLAQNEASKPLSVQDQKKFDLLLEILKSKNDNDPRMDVELKNLSPELKRKMMSFYSTTKPEARNERGTVVFLLGREIKTNEDIDFLESVLLEKPCLNLVDCSKPVMGLTPEEEHLAVTNEVTANYPQLMAQRQMLANYRARRDADPNDPKLELILEAFRAAQSSPNPRIASDAQRILRELGKE